MVYDIVVTQLGEAENTYGVLLFSDDNSEGSEQVYGGLNFNNALEKALELQTVYGVTVIATSSNDSVEDKGSVLVVDNGVYDEPNLFRVLLVTDESEPIETVGRSLERRDALKLAVDFYNKLKRYSLVIQ